MALSSENLLLLILMMEMKHFQLTHMNTLALTHFHTCRVTLWLGGDSANTLCVILLARLWLLRCRWQSNKRIWDWLVIVGPANRPWRGGSLQSSWANKGLLLLMATHTHTHRHTHKGMTQVCRDMCWSGDSHTMSPAGWTALPSQIDIRQSDAGQIHIMTGQFLM